MKKTLAILLSTALAAGLWAGSVSADETEGQEVTVINCGTTTGFYPYAFQDEDDNFVGYDIDLITAVFDRLPQYELVFQLNDWDAILTGLDSGLYQISTECIFYSEDRAEKYYFSDPISYDPVVAVTGHDHADVSTLEDLAGETLPVTTGSIWAIAIEKFNEDHPDKFINLEYSDTDYFTRFTRAESGERIIMADYGSALGMVDLNGFTTRLQFLDPENLQRYIDPNFEYFLMSRYGDEAAQLQQDVNEALAEVIADGTARELSLKYFKEDLTPQAYENGLGTQGGETENE